MALHWDAKDCAGEIFSGEGEDRRMDGICETMIFATMFVGMPKITEDNFQEWCERIRAWEKGIGFLVSRREDRFLSAEEMRPFIGITTNASAYTPAKFRKHLAEAVMRSAAEELRYEERALSRNDD